MSLKLSLDEPATEAVHSMLKQIKEQDPGSNVSPSGLASWILVHFSEKLFEKYKNRIANHHFNAKAYLRSKLKEIDSPEQLETMLAEVRTRLRSTKDVSSKEPYLEGEPNVKSVGVTDASNLK